MSRRAAAVAPAPLRTAVARAVAPLHAPPQPESGPVDAGTGTVVARAARSFATLPARTPVNADVERMRATQRLLEQLAPALGLDASRIRVEFHGAVKARLDAAGAQGLQEGSTIWLHPTGYNPDRVDGRRLLAHEAAHAAQRQLTGPVDERAAEWEAAEIGSAFASGRVPRRPRFALVAGRAAADAGEKSSAVPTVDSDMIRTSRARELAVIRGALGGLWVSDGDVFDVMRILDSVPYPIVKPLLMALSEQERYWLADNINPPHVYQHRRSVLASYYGTLSDYRLRDAVDLKVFRAMPWSGLSTEETEAAAWTLQHLSDGQRQELLRSSNGLAITRIIAAPRPTAKELERMRDEAAQAARDEAKLADERRAIAAMEKDSDANDLFEQVQRLLSPSPTDFSGPRPTGAQARAALDLLAKAQGNRSRLLYVAERMEQAGLIDHLLELLPADAFFDTSAHSSTLLDLVQSRLPFKNAKLVESLLSYGLFDWAIRDYEALFAYKLIRLLPLTDQYRFRLRDGGKWYLRLLDNLPDDPDTKLALPGIEIRKAESRDEIARLREQGATEVDEKNLLYNASQVYEKKRLEAGTNDAIKQLVEAFEQADKGAFSASEAKDLFRRLRVLGSGSLERGKEKPADQILRETVVRELDRRGWIERLFDKLPDSFLFAEENRVETVRLMLARDPTRVTAMARRLVSYRFTDWMVNDGEAYLAYQCIKALPEDERRQFIADEPDLWARVTGEMSESQRQSRDLNAYIGDRAGTDRGSVLGRLAEPASWTDDNAALLGDLVRMAIAMTEHRFAFERSREFKAFESTVLAPLVEKYRLWDPRRRPVYTPDILQGTRWYEEGVFASLKSLWGGIVTLATADFLLVDRKVGVRLDLGHAQDFLGGDLMGAKVDESDRARHPERNKVTLLVSPDGQSVELILPQLVLESANVQLGGATLQSGRVTLEGLHLEAAYQSESLLQPARAQAKIEKLVAEDLLLAKTSSMVTATRLVVSALRLAAGTIDTVAPGVRRGGESAVPVPLLVVPMLPLLLLLGLPVYLFYRIASFAKSLPDQGLQDPGQHLAEDIIRNTKAISFTLGSLDVDSLTTSGGQHVGHASVRDFSVRAGLNKATRLRAEARSLSQRIAALPKGSAATGALEALEKRRADVEAELKAVDADEIEYLQIMREIRAGKASPERQKELQRRLDALKFDEKAGAFIDIGAVEVSGLSGTVTSKEPIRVANVHGEGGGTALAKFIAIPTATDAELSRRSGAGERPAHPLDAGQDGHFVLDLGDIKTGELQIGGGLRTVADIEHEIAELEPRKTVAQFTPLYESLLALREKARRYELMLQHGVSRLDEAQLAEFRRLRGDLTAQADLVVQSLAIVHAKLDADIATGSVGVAAESIRATGIQAPRQGIQVDEIVARGVGLSALPKGGLLGWADWKANFRDAEGHIDSLEISGARSRYHGLLFEKATLTGAYAKVKQRGNEVALGLKQLTGEGLGLVPRLGLLNRRLDSLREKARVAKTAEKPALEQEIRKLAALLAELQALADRRLAAFMQLERAKTPDEIKTAKDEVAEVDGIIAYDLAQYGVAKLQLDEFGVRVTGAGDVLSDALGGGIDPLALLERGGVTVAGTGPNDRLFKQLSLHHAQTVSHLPEKGLQADVGSFDVGETRVRIGARKDGDSLLVDVPRFELDSMSIDRLLLTASEGEEGFQAWSTGKSGIERVVVRGSLRLDSRVAGSRELADYRLAQVHFDHFEIGRLYGNGLGFTMLGKKLELEIKSGSINGIKGDGVDVEIPEDADASPKVTGKLGIDSIDKLVVGKAVVGAWAVSGGRIDAKSIGVELFEDGGIKAAVGDLDLTDFAVRGPDGWVRFSLADLGGRFGWRNGVLDVEDFHFGSLRVAAIHWKVGEHGFVEAKKPSTISDVALKGRVETRLEPAKAAPGKPVKAGETERRPSRIRIERLHIGKVESDELTYQDESNRIEIRPANPMAEKTMVGFKPLFIQNLDVWGLEWTPADGIKSGKAAVGTYEASAHYEGLKSGLRAGIALSGKGMSAEMVGKDAFTVDVGKIEKTGGELHNAKFDTRFATGSIVGKVAIGPDYVEAQDVEIGKARFSGLRYRDLPKILTLDGVNVDRIKLGRVRQNYTVSTDAATKGEKVPSTLEVRDLELFDVTAYRLDYRGESRGTVGEGKDKKDTISTQHIKGRYATISHLQVSRFDHDAILDKGSFSAKIDTAAGAKPGTRPFGIQGLSAELVETVGSEKTTKALVTDVSGGPLTANDIKFDTVVLGTTTGPDGKPVDVTRTRVDGSFELTRLGFVNPDLTLTDAKGRTTQIGGLGSSIEIAGIKPRFLPNGSIALPVDAVIAKDLRIKHGDMTVRLPLLEIKNIAVGMTGMGTDKGIDWLAAKVGQIHFTGASIEIVKTHKAELSDAEYEAALKEFEEAQAAEKADPSGTFIAEPLSGLQGSASGEVNVVIDIPYTNRYVEYPDPDINAKFVNGVLDFGGMTNYSVQLRTEDVTREGVTRPEDKVTLGNFPPYKTLKDFKRKMPGFYAGRGKSGYGQIVLRETIEGLVNEPATAPSRTFEPAAGLYDFIGFTGNFLLGDGRMGFDKDGDKKLAEGDSWIEFTRTKPEHNTIKLLESNIGDEVKLEMPEFHFGGAGFTAGKTQKGATRIGKTGEITLQQMAVRVKGLAAYTMTITLEIKDGVIQNVEIGELKFLDATELGKLSEPSLHDVDPKGVPKQ